MLTRLRRALIPRDPLYRRESGAGRRIVMIAKIAGAVAVFGAYLLWTATALARKDARQLTVGITVAASCFFCLLAFALGLQSVRNEITGGTAEALVMTPLSRWKVITSKLAGSAEFIVIAALLLPLYCYTLISGHGGTWTRTYLHGGLFRCWLVFGANWPYSLQEEQSFLVDGVVGLGAFAGDLAWYLLLAACGAWAAVSRRTALAVWIKGLLVAGCVLVGLSFIEWIGLDYAGATDVLEDLLQADNLRDVISAAADYDLFGPYWHWFWGPKEELSPSWTAAWIVIAIGLRLLFAWFFLWRAANNFDRIATD